MTRRWAQLVTVILMGYLLTGCPSKEGAEPVDDPETFFQNPLPLGKPVYTDIVEPFFGLTDGDEDDSLSLISYDPAQDTSAFDPDTLLEKGLDNPAFIFNSDVGEIVSLDLDPDDENATELSVLINDDSIYTVDHRNGQLRLLKHFTNQVCEIIPAEIVDTTTDAGLTTHSVRHADWVYVMTADETEESDDCANPDAIKRFYELALNYQFNAVESEICIEDGGTSTSADCRTNELPIVNESLARAELVFGWHENELKVGYLGYGQAESLLRFFDRDRTQLWAQPRVLQSFAVVTQNGETTPETLFHLEPLASFQYLLQLGRDIFVFDAGEALFDKDFNDQATILTDRTHHLETVIAQSGSVEIIQPVDMQFDSNDLVIRDQNKFYRYRYLSAPLATPGYQVEDLRDIGVESQLAESIVPFSQFDLRDCATSADEAACDAAHDVDDDNWQFIADCSLATDCSFETPASEDCDTPAEILVNPTLDNPCDPGNYLHLSELDSPANNTEFRGYMQYVSDYARSLEYEMQEDVIYLTVRMQEKDILLRYFFNVDLSDPKASREQVIWGERLAHQGLMAFFNDGNLYTTTLRATATRSDQCYKNYQRVECDLGELVESGSASVCTGFDLSEGSCTNEFVEYESQALFCDSDQLLTATCSDDQLIPANTLASEADDEDAKWIELVDADGDSDIYILLADESNTAYDGEGVLANPDVYAVDDLTGAPNLAATLGTVPGEVEAVRTGWWKNTELGRLPLISEEVIQTGGGALASAKSRRVLFFLSNGGAPEVTPVHQQPITRMATAPDDN